jgi:hypothetical protein
MSTSRASFAPHLPAELPGRLRPSPGRSTQRARALLAADEGVARDRPSAEHRRVGEKPTSSSPRTTATCRASTARPLRARCCRTSRPPACRAHHGPGPSRRPGLGRLVANIDLAPTIRSLAGATAGKTVRTAGSLSPFARNPQLRTKRAICTRPGARSTWARPSRTSARTPGDHEARADLPRDPARPLAVRALARRSRRAVHPPETTRRDALSATQGAPTST